MKIKVLDAPNVYSTVLHRTETSASTAPMMMTSPSTQVSHSDSDSEMELPRLCEPRWCQGEVTQPRNSLSYSFSQMYSDLRLLKRLPTVSKGADTAPQTATVASSLTPTSDQVSRVNQRTYSLEVAKNIQFLPRRQREEDPYIQEILP